MSTKNMHDACRTVSPEDKTMKVIKNKTTKQTNNLSAAKRRPVEIRPQGMGQKVVAMPDGRICRIVNGQIVEA